MNKSITNEKILGWPVKTVLEDITKQLDGSISHYTTLDHSGRQTNKIVIEYNVSQREK
tara:strand:- start:349 stop:522 length:174 start_codon:yes stop_codon:yes gene_type:complete